MITPEILVAGAALCIAAGWIVYQYLALQEADAILNSAEEALQAAHKAVDIYQRVLTDVAHNQATLEVTDDGHIIATHHAIGKVQVH
jgi:ATP/maltotriose-dependent transcriptional regulator MalT